MARSLKKGPFVDHHLLGKVERASGEVKEKVGDAVDKVKDAIHKD